MFFGLLSRQSAGSRSTLRWDYDGELQDAAGDEAADGAAVAVWLAGDRHSQLAQATGGNRPTADDDGFPGRRAALFDATDHLLSTPPWDVGTVLVVFGLVSGVRTVAAQDTSDTTTKPLFGLRLEGIGGGHLVDLSGNVLISTAGNYLATPDLSASFRLAAGSDLLIATAGNYLSAQ